MDKDEVIEALVEDVESLKKGLAELTTDHVAVVKQLRQQVLELQRYVAVFKVNADSEGFFSIMDTQLSGKTHYPVHRSQLMTDATKVKQQIFVSSAPFELLTQFHNNWEKKLNDLGCVYNIY